jgi:hypothetical protein
MDRHGLFKRESECCACLEKKPLTVVISNDTICHECLQYIFQKALNNEAEYPAKWGGITLNPKDYYHEKVVSQSFIRGYQEKQKEYHCQVARRVYCSWITTPAYQGKGKGKSNDQICQTFLGKNIQNPTTWYATGATIPSRCAVSAIVPLVSLVASVFCITHRGTLTSACHSTRSIPKVQRSKA